MTGIIHSYYTVVMAPAIGALGGHGTVDLWRARAKAIAVSPGSPLPRPSESPRLLAWDLLNRTPELLARTSSAIVLVVGLGAAAVIAVACAAAG